MGKSGRTWAWFGVVLAFSGGGLSATAPAAADTDCAAIAGGALDVSLDGEAKAARQVALKPGDRLTITFDAATAGPFGTVAMSDGSKAPRSLLVGPSGTRVTFTARRAGTYAFEFAADGAEPAGFSASCEATRGFSASARGRGVKLLERPLGAEDEFAVAELAGVVLDAGQLPQPSAKPNSAPMSVAAPPAPPGPIAMTMKWRGERYKVGGPDGPEVDHSRSGVDAAVNYKLLPEIMVSALAQVDQPGETMIARPLDLSEQGWMAGPGATIKLAPGLSFDARAAWGIAESSDDPFSGRSTALPRRAVSAKLTSSQSFGAWRFSPSVSLNHLQAESASAAVDPHEPGASPVSGSGRVDIAPEVAYRINLDGPLFIEPRAQIGGFWTVDDLSRFAPPHGGHGDMRLKAEAGVTVGAGDGTKFQATGGVEEGQPGAQDVWSGRLQLSVPIK